jgi:GT2 family glycosyltransferase
MRLSIVIVCLNEQSHLERCLAAIGRLDHAGLDPEVTVVDGGSRDRSRELARDRGVRVIECSRGIPLARNVGGRAAEGDLLAYVDADVELQEGWFSTVARAFSVSRRRIVGAPPQLPADASWLARAYEMHDVPPRLLAGVETEHVHLVTCHSLAMGREVFEAVGGFRQDLAVNEDAHFVRRARELGIPVVCDVGLRYVHHGEPGSLREFFRRTVWGATYEKWFGFLRRGDLAQAWRPQYLFGAAIAGELLALALSLALALGGWWPGVPLALLTLAATVGLPALRTAIRHAAPAQAGQLALMYAIYGLANAAALAGLGRDKGKRWR